MGVGESKENTAVPAQHRPIKPDKPEFLVATDNLILRASITLCVSTVMIALTLLVVMTSSYETCSVLQTFAPIFAAVIVGAEIASERIETHTFEKAYPGSWRPNESNHRRADGERHNHIQILQKRATISTIMAWVSLFCLACIIILAGLIRSAYRAASVVIPCFVGIVLLLDGIFLVHAIWSVRTIRTKLKESRKQNKAEAAKRTNHVDNRSDSGENSGPGDHDAGEFESGYRDVVESDGDDDHADRNAHDHADRNAHDRGDMPPAHAQSQHGHPTQTQHHHPHPDAAVPAAGDHVEPPK